MAPKDFPLVSSSPFGQQLRYWRQQRRLSQLNLAMASQTTPRHVSFLETGRSRPGEDMVLRLGSALNLPLKDQNRFLIAAGFAPVFQDQSDENLTSHPLFFAIKEVLENHAPYPGCAMNRLGKILSANEPFLRLVPNALTRTVEEQVIDFFKDPAQRKLFANWRAMAWHLLDRSRRESSLAPDAELMKQLDLIERLAAEVTPTLSPDDLRGNDEVADVLSPTFVVGGEPIRTYTTVMRFDAPQEVVLAELRIELVFPRDEAAKAMFASLLGN